MRLALTAQSLKQTTPWEYASRFVFGGLVTVFAGLIADHFGPVVGGMFLAFPGIFPAGVGLVEAHKVKRELAEGKCGIGAARGEASVEATGASAGVVGLAAFAIVLGRGLPGHSLGSTLIATGVAWVAVSWTAWRMRERM